MAKPYNLWPNKNTYTFNYMIQLCIYTCMMRIWRFWEKPAWTYMVTNSFKIVIIKVLWSVVQVVRLLLNILIYNDIQQMGLILYKVVLLASLWTFL